MKPQEIVSKTIATIRASKNVELRMTANEHPEETMTLAEVADAVDQALQEVSQTLTAVLSNEGEDEKSGQGDWGGFVSRRTPLRDTLEQHHRKLSVASYHYIVLVGSIGSKCTAKRD